MKQQVIFIAGFILALLMTGCENNPSGFDDLNQSTTIAEEEIFDLKSTEATDRDITSARFGGHLMHGGMMVGGPHLFFGRNFPDCATVTVSGNEFPKEIVIDYGESCTGDFGMERTGTITLEMSDTILNAGAVYTITFDDVSFGRKQVDKTVIVTNEGINDEEHWVISFQSVSTTTFEHEEEVIIITREYAGQKEWLSGFETPEVKDDQFLKSGGGTMLVNEELKFERQITDPLLVDRSCRHPLSGVIEITKDGDTMMIDFGNGECDNIAVVTKDGESEEIDLNRGRFRNGFQRKHRHMKHSKNWW